MFCPYYKNKEVFDGFNEIVEALGGKPLTEDEFRSSELRNQRTGVDYSAMEAAYRMYHRNNGNMPDLAPNGKHSILFDTLLEYFNGDRAKAIEAKSNVYSDEFFNWFGDWINDPTNASKVIDENGEPLVVYRGERGESKNIIDTSRYGYRFFVSDKGVADSYNKNGNNTRAFFLNIKQIKEIDAQGEMWDAIPIGEKPKDIFDNIPTTTTKEIAKNLVNEGFDGGIVKNVVDFGPNAIHAYPATDFIIIAPNQAKSATDNSGTFSRENDDIQMFISNQDNKRRNASSRSISRQLIQHLRSSGINVYGRSKMEQYLRLYSDVLTQLFIGKKSRDKFKQQLIKARPDLAIPGYSINGVDFVKGVLSDEQIPVGYIDHATGIKLKKEGIIEEGTYSQWRLTEKGKAKAEAGYPEIDAILDFLHSLEDNKENTAYIKTAIRWIVNRSLTLPDDHTKAYQAFELARKKHLDLQKYPTLGALITSSEMQPKEKEKETFNPDTAKTFSNKRTVTTEGGRVFTVYDVENTEEGQRDVCKALAAHYEMSPWCLSTFTATGEPTQSAKHYWNVYNAIPRKIAYEDGKPVAFNSAAENRDNSHTFRGFPVSSYMDFSSGPQGHNVYEINLFNPDLDTLNELNALEEQGLIVRDDDVPNRKIYIAYVTPKGRPELVKRQQEAWWDMEDRNPREQLDDYIVSEQRSMMTGREEDEIADGLEPFEPDPLEMYEADVLNSARSFLNDYILSYIRVENLVPAGMNEIGVRNYLVDRYLEEGRIRDILETQHLEGNSFEIAQNVLNQLDVFNRIGHTIDSYIQELPQPAAPINPNPESLEDDTMLPFFMTPNGEIYGFVTKNGDIYLDDTIISPEHPIHEYTHLWDRIVSKRNPELWQRGVELMKQTSEWNKILNDDNYGKRWKSDSSISETQLEFLIASEVHARLTGEYGEQIINDIANKKGSKNIIDKLKQWILDFWKDLKSTFSSWSKEDLQRLTVEDFNKMTVRDLVELKQNGNTYGMKQPYIPPSIQELNVDLSQDLMVNTDNTKANEYGDKFGWSIESITNHLIDYVANSAGVPDIEAKRHVKDINDRYGTNFGVYRKNGVRMLKRNTKPISELSLTENPNGNDGMINKTTGSKFSQYKLDSRKEGFSELMRMLNDDPELYYEYLEYLGKDVESKC